MSEKPKTARIQSSWECRQWLKILAVIDDHPRVAILSPLVVLGSLTIYATYLGGFSHFVESGARWRVDIFGGTHRVDRAVRTPDVLLLFDSEKFTRLDALAPTATHFGGTVFRKELRAMVDREGGLIRIAALDPRLSDPGHRENARFVALAEGAEAPYFCLGRSGHAYHSGEKAGRLDVIVLRPAEPTGSDSFTHPGMILKNPPENSEVVRFTESFELVWKSATLLDGELQKELNLHFDGQ